MSSFQRVVRTGCALIAAAGVASSALAQGLPKDGKGLAGVYGGSYACQDGEHGIQLDLKKVTAKKEGGFDASGVLGFFPVLAGKAGSSADVSGSFEVTGTIAADGAISLTAGKWLKQPPGYGAAALQGKLQARSDGLLKITGKPVVPGRDGYCTDLVATRFLP